MDKLDVLQITKKPAALLHRNKRISRYLNDYEFRATASLYQCFSPIYCMRQTMNAATGLGVTVIVFVMAVFMIIRANKVLAKRQISNSPTEEGRF